jgi:hypothetical protein
MFKGLIVTGPDCAGPDCSGSDIVGPKRAVPSRTCIVFTPVSMFRAKFLINIIEFSWDFVKRVQ